MCALCMDDLLYYLTVVDLLGGAGGGVQKISICIIEHMVCASSKQLRRCYLVRIHGKLKIVLQIESYPHNV